MGTSEFSAVDATLGYLYQIRSALLWSLQRMKSRSFRVSIETLDDVTFDDAKGDPVELVQTKHHRTSTANLANASVDLWKTLRVWCTGWADGTIPSDAALVLVTTGTATAGSVAESLGTRSRSVATARSDLDTTARMSANRSNELAYELYLGLPASSRDALLENVVVIDSSPNIDALNECLREEVFWAAERGHLDAFLDRLEGWWLRRVLTQMVDHQEGGRDRIGSAEIEARMSDLREQFKRDSLPVDDDLLEFVLDDATASTFAGQGFVRQLEIVDASAKRVAAAIRDYYRAFEQRSRWVREDLAVNLELDKYERRLVEAWELVFEAMRDEMEPDAVEEERRRAARQVLSWAESVSLPIRPEVAEPFVVRGSLHILSNGIRIGWHPDFRERLAELLTEEGAA